jgi:hypothetical protein
VSVLSWSEIRAKVLEKAPNAAVALDVVERYWGDGKLTEEIATQFVQAYCRGDYVAARKALYGTMSPLDLINEDKAENERLARIVEAETKVYNFFGELEGVVLKVALGAALAAVGL